MNFQAQVDLFSCLEEKPPWVYGMINGAVLVFKNFDCSCCLTIINMLLQKMSASSLQSLGASSIQPGQPSSLPLQHRLQSSLDDRHKASVTLSNSQNHCSSCWGAFGFGSAMNIETLVAASERRETPIEAPALEIQDKISFIINNISAANVEAKAKEFTEIFKEQYYPWFAQYMVIESYQWKQFPARVYFFQVLLGSELIKSSSEERSLLKNLGSWLGKFTIGRNQVLKAREIDPKSLIIEAYEKGLMIAVIPFTSKVLFKNLGVDMKDITPTSLLENRPRQVEGNPDFSNKDIGASHPPMISEVKSAIVSMPNKVELPVEVAILTLVAHTFVISGYYLLLKDCYKPPITITVSVSQPTTLIPNIGTHVIINQKISALGLHLHFQRVAPIAMDRAIKEILSGMVQRSVNIASQTTKELVLKEPLRASLARQLGNLLQGLTISNERLEQAVQLVTNDNLDKACAEMERAAADMCFGVKSDVLLMVQLVHPGLEKETTSVASFCDPLVLKDAQVSNLRTAVQTIDKELEIRLSLRRKHREGIGSTFLMEACIHKVLWLFYREALRPKPGHLSLSQQQVYEHYKPCTLFSGFVQLPRQNQANEGSNMLPADSAPPGGAGQSVSHGSALVQLDPTIYSSSPGNSGLMAVSQSLDFVTEDLESTSVQLLSASSTHMGMGDGVIKHISENDSVVASFPSTASASDLHSVEPSDAVKELVTASQSFPSTVASERLGISISEPLVTRDALDKYQIVAEKLETLVTNGASESELQVCFFLTLEAIEGYALRLYKLALRLCPLMLVDEEGEWVDINTDKEDKITIGYDYIP
ncbi:CCR4-NOT transcription complex subunit 1 [Vitis vinifera]|uniref:CCR4-NOT transcription complex subunit 1 n=1 Tax=Vitis vinifera TaxID=29760 RepID=A0A438BW61_VITVI|nr:CCR4-NOT transcription complex subunit 1 [Vitis vinifera]